MTEPINTYSAMNDEIAKILRMSGEQPDLYAAQYIEELQAEVERLRAKAQLHEADTLRLLELNGELASMLRGAREEAAHLRVVVDRYEAERAEAKEVYPENLCDCGMGDATRAVLHDKTCAVHRG